MSSIRKYYNDGNGREWRKFGEVNKEFTANDISANNIYTNQISSVQKILDQQQYDIDKLKRNVAWLALHGGGGSGGSVTPGGIKYVTASMTLNTYSSKSVIQILDKDETTLNIKIENIKPASAQSKVWSINVLIAGKVIRKNDTYQDGTTYTIKYSEFKNKINKTDQNYVDINATIVDSAGEYTGSTSWTGYIVIPQIDIKPNITKNFIRDYIFTTPSEENSYYVNTTTTTYGTYSLSTSGKCGTKYTNEISTQFDIKSGHTTETTVIELSQLFSGKRYDEIQPGKYEMTSKLSSNLDFTYDISYNMTILKKGLTLVANDISYDENYPTSVDSVIREIKPTFVAYHSDNQFQDAKYNLSIYIVNNTEENYLTSYLDYKINQSYTKQISIPKQYSIQTRPYVLKFVAEIPYEAEQDKDQLNTYFIIADNEPKISISSLTSINMLMEFDWMNNSFSTGDPFKDEFTLSTENLYATYGSQISIFNNNYTSGKREVDVSNGKKQGAFCFKNGCYGIVNPEFKVLPSGSTYKLCEQASWVINLSFKSDKYSNDNHIIFAYGTPDINSGKITNGIAVKTHGIYICESEKIYNKKVDLQDQTKTVVTLVYRNGNGTTGSDKSTWPTKYDTTQQTTLSYFKIYVDGVLTYVTKDCPFQVGDNGVIDNKDCKLYIGGTNDNTTCESEIYQINIYSCDQIGGRGDSRTTPYLNQQELLGLLINSKLNSNYLQTGYDKNLKETLLNQNLSFQNNDAEISSAIILPQGLNFNDVVFIRDGNTYKLPTNVDELNRTQLKEYIDKKKIVLPVVFIDMSQNAAAWTFNDFTSIDKSSYTKVQQTKLYYLDPTSNAQDYTKYCAIVADSTTVAIQGTSTKTDYIKNIDVTLFREKELEEGGYIKEDLLQVKPEWVPEHTYTLKADVVDSAHANNASIGKFINRALSADYEYKNSFSFGFDTNAEDNFEITKNIFRESTLKHTVEGFPVLLFIHFYGSTAPVLLGIYSFNLGRAAIRNLGFVRVEEIRENLESDPLDFNSFSICPNYHSQHLVKENATNNTFWIEIKDSRNLSSDEVAKLSSTQTEVDITDLDLDTHRVAFWQSDTTVLDNRFEVRYPEPDEEDENKKIWPSTVQSLIDAVEEVTKLPIEGYSETNMEQKVAGARNSYIYGSYSNWKLNGNIDEKLQTVTLMDNSEEARPITKIDVSHAQSYFVIAMLFGLRDNFEKNISFRIFNSDNSKSKYTLDFYDLDTALGITNVGNQEVSPILWIKKFYNKSINNDQYYLFGETFADNDDNEIHTITTDGELKYNLEAEWNKLWLTIDSHFYNTHEADGFTKNGGYSEYSKKWFNFRRVCETLSMKSELHTTDFVEYFMKYFFTAQTEQCGSVLFNHDYNMKYLNVFKNSSHPDAINCTTTSTINKLHGRREEFTRRWLTERINFLDSYFFWRNKSHYIDSDNLPSLLGEYSDRQLYTSNTNDAFFTGSTSTTNIMIQTDKPTIVRSRGSTGGNTSFALCQKDKQTPIYADIAAEQNFSLFNITDVYQWTIESLRPSKIGSSTHTTFQNIQAVNLNGASFSIGGFDISQFGTINNPSQLTSISMRSILGGSSFGIDVHEDENGYNAFPRLVNIDVSESTQLTSLGLAANIPYKTLSLNGSGINQLTIQNQKYIKLPDFDRCKSLTDVNIRNCSFENRPNVTYEDYANIFLSANTQIRSITLNNVQTVRSITLDYCPVLTSINIQDCKNLESIKINRCDMLTSANAITLFDNDILSSIDISENEKLNTICVRSSHLSNITNLNLESTKVTYITYYDNNGRPYIPTYDGSPMLDLKDFTGLQSTNNINTRLIADLSCIRFPNIAGHPVKIMHSMGENVYSPATTRKNNKLRRILGNIEIDQNYAFWGLSAFSIFGDDPSNKWDNTNINVSTSKTFWELEAETGFNIFQTNNSNEINVDANSGATNVQIGKAVNNGFSGEGIFREANCSWLDVYYILYKIAKLNSSVKQEEKIKKLQFTLNSKNDNKALTELPNNIFKGLADITSVYMVFKVKNIKLTKNIMSKLSGITHLGTNAWDYTGIFHEIENASLTADIDVLDLDSTTTKRNMKLIANFLGERWKIETKGGEAITYGRLLKNVTGLTEIFNSFNFNNAIQIDGVFNLPTTLTTIKSSFTFDNASGKVSLSSIFNKKYDSLTAIQNSFNCEKNTNVSVFYHPSSFSNLPALQYYGSSTGNNSTVTLNSKARKYIVTDEFILNGFQHSNEDTHVYTTSMWEEFTQNLLSSCRNLIAIPRLLENAQLSQYDQIEDISFPNKLFINCKSLQDIHAFMKNFNGTYQLTPNGLSSCKNIHNVSQLFYQDIYEHDKNYIGDNKEYFGEHLHSIYVYPTFISSGDNPNYFLFERLKYGITSDIPYHLFYSGQTDTNLTTYGINNVQFKPYSYNEEISELKKSLTCSNNVSLSNIMYKCLITETSYKSLSSNCKEIFSKLSAQVPVYDSNLIQNYYQSKCPLSSKDGSIKDECKNIVSTLTSIIQALSDVNKWKNNIISVQTSDRNYKKPTYNKPITNMSQCFYGNAQIKPYSGSTVTEFNESYSPFKYILDISKNTWTEEDEVDNYVYDDSWSYNGEISNSVGTITINPNNKNISTRNTQPLNDIVDESKKLSYLYSSHDGGKTHNNIPITGYIRTKKDNNELKYICSPDLLRYSKADSDITKLFQNCGTAGWRDYRARVEGAQFEPSGSDNGINLSAGIKGRIPENLLYPLTNIASIDGLFQNCKQITGYKIKSEDGQQISTYLIPPLFLKKQKKLMGLEETFFGMYIPFSTDLSTVFKNLDNGSARQYYNLIGVFANCCWSGDDTNIDKPAKKYIYEKIFDGKYCSGIGAAFSLTKQYTINEKTNSSPRNASFGITQYPEYWSTVTVSSEIAGEQLGCAVKFGNMFTINSSGRSIIQNYTNANQCGYYQYICGTYALLSPYVMVDSYTQLQLSGTFTQGSPSPRTASYFYNTQYPNQ